MKKLFNQLMHFGIIGVFNTILGYVLIMVFYNVLHWNYWVASGTSYLIGSIFSYFANKRLTFKVEDKDPRFALRFAINTVVCYVTAYGIAKPLVRTLMAGYSQMLSAKIGMEAKALEENVAIIFGMGFYIILNFIGQKFFVFKEEKKDN